jgi:hypothetical protein
MVASSPRRSRSKLVVVAPVVSTVRLPAPSSVYVVVVAPSVVLASRPDASYA